MNNNRDVWDKIAERAVRLRSQQPGGQRKAEFYLTVAYLRLAQKALGYLRADKVRLLKTDLWNEAVDTERSILEKISFPGKTLDLYGVDVSETVCQRAQELSRRTKVCEGDIRQLPFAKKFFDIVLDLSTIDHIPRDDLPVALGEYQRVLKKNGVLALVFWQDDRLLRFLNWLSRRLVGKPLIDNQTQFAFSAQLVRGELAGGFEILDTFPIGTLFPLVVGWKKVLPVFECLPKAFYRGWLALELSGFFPLPGRLKVFVARKR